MRIMLNRDTEPLTGFEIVDQAQRSIRNLHIKYFQIIWSFFDINEDLFKVISLFEKDNLSKKEKIEWLSEECLNHHTPQFLKNLYHQRQ